MKLILKIFKILDAKEKKTFLKLVILILLVSFIDILGAASILPFIAVLVNPNLIETNIVIKFIYRLSTSFGTISNDSFLIILGFICFFGLLFALITRSYAHYKYIEFSLFQELNISKRLIKNYLNKEYSWFLDKTSSNLSKNILSEVGVAVNNAILPLMQLISHTASTLLFLIFLILINPILATIIILVFVSLYLYFYNFTKKIISHLSSERVLLNKKRFETAIEPFESIKEIKLRGVEKFYVDRFYDNSLKYTTTNIRSTLFSILPRYFIEGVGFGGMILIILFLIRFSADIDLLIPIVSLYAYIGYRLLPSIQQIYNSIININFSSECINFLHLDLMNEVINDNKSFKNRKNLLLKNFIKVNNISYKYPSTNKFQINDISFSISAYSKIGIIGAIGSGKTTLIDVILGLLDPVKGNIEIEGNTLGPNNKKLWQKIIGYVPQKVYLADNTIKNNITLGSDEKIIDNKLMEDAARIVNLHKFITTELSDGYNTSIGQNGIKLSGGQRQLLGIARAIYFKPQIIIMDESTNALDPFNELLTIKSVISNLKKTTFIFISHSSRVMGECDKIFLLEEGKLKAEGSFEDLSKYQYFKKKLY